MRLLLDAHMSDRGVGEPMRRQGHDVVAAAQEPPLKEMVDEVLFRVATSQGRIMVTHDVRDFSSILTRWGGTGESHAGCILIKGIDHSEFGRVLRGLRRLLKEHPSQEEWENLVLWLTPGSAR